MEYQEPIGAEEDASYIDANPAAGIEGSPVPAAAIEHPMREIVEVITQAGLTPDAADLTQLWQVIRRAWQQPLTTLEYPTICTTDRRLVVTPSAAAAGGKVSVVAGTVLRLGAKVDDERGVMRDFTLPAWTSADLVVSSTYYLRAQVAADGSLLMYMTKGTDSDAIPASLVGTADAAAGGGFDSTRLDCLIARVVTGVAGTVPTVTTLANAARLEVSAIVTPDSYNNPGVNNSQALYHLDLNWGRKPTRTPTIYMGAYSNVANTDYDYNSFAVMTYTRYIISGRTMSDFMDDANINTIFISVNA